MTDEKLLCFSPAEFTLMLEMAGDGPYSALQGDAEPDEAALTAAFSTLFRRGLIERAGDRFVLSAAGYPFVRMRRAPFAVSAMTACGRSAMCYPDGNAFWAAELSSDRISQWYRVQRIGGDALAPWLLDTGVLRAPVLRDEDAAEIGKPLEEEPCKPSGAALASLRRYRNGGGLLCAYELMAVQGGQLILYGGAEEYRAEIYTEEALARMLAECFGKDAHDNRQCEGPRY